MPTTAFVLGAGLGTRLRPLTDDTPKPLLPVGGRAMVEHAFAHLAGLGCNRFIVNTHHAAARWRERYPDASWQGRALAWSHEPVLLDTGGGMLAIAPLLGPGDDAIWLYNGDILADLPLQACAADWAAHPEAKAVLVLRTAGPLPNVRIDASGRVTDLRNLNGAAGGILRQYTGIAIVARSLWPDLAGEARARGPIFSLIPLLARLAAAQPGSVRGVTIDEGAWTDLGTHEEYAEACATFGKRPSNP